MKKIVLRADGNAKIGLGHIYRLKALGEYFEDKTAIIFLSNDQISHLLKNTWSFLQVAKKNEISYIKAQFDPQEVVIFLDGYHFDYTYQNQLKKNGFKFLFIDDFNAFDMIADVVINPSISVGSSAYQGCARLGLGTHYSPLRSAFLKKAQIETKYEAKTKQKIFVSLGGTDFYNLSQRIITALNELPFIKEVHLMVGASYENKALTDAKFNLPLKIHKGLSANQIVNLVEDCDLAISSASTISYELCSCRIPLIVGWYAKNQIDLYNGLVQSELAKGVGNLIELDKEELKQTLKSLFRVDYSAQIAQQTKFFSGRNKELLYSLVLPLLAQLKLSVATINDTEQYFNWANDKDVRANSFSPDPIAYEQHVKWFENKLNQSDSYLFVAREYETNVGQLRFDKVGDVFEIDYSIDKRYRGRGYGTQIIALGLQLMWEKDIFLPVRAKVKFTNKASVAVFKKLGFVEKPIEQVNGMLIFEYSL